MKASNLTHLYYDIGRYQEAELLFERTLAGFEKLPGSNDPSTLGAVNNLANILKKIAAGIRPNSRSRGVLSGVIS